MESYPNAIIIGGGTAAIVMAYKLTQIDFTDFTIYAKLDGICGTWWANTYPGTYLWLISTIFLRSLTITF